MNRVQCKWKKTFRADITFGAIIRDSDEHYSVFVDKGIGIGINISNGYDYSKLSSLNEDYYEVLDITDIVPCKSFLKLGQILAGLVDIPDYEENSDGGV